MIHPLAPMVMQFALSLMEHNPLYQGMTLDKVIEEVLSNLGGIEDYFTEEDAETRH